MNDKPALTWPFDMPSPFPKDPSNLLSAIQRFNELDLQKVPDDELRSRILDIIIPVSARSFGLPEKLYRVRKGGVLTTVSDLWAPPVPIAGRISTENHGVLYTASDVPSAIIESGVADGEEFSLITYTAKKNSSFCFPFFLDHDFIDSNFKGTDLLFLKIQRNFIDNLYLRHAPVGFEYLYRPTQFLSWEILDTATALTGVDGFVYASVANYRSGWNYAIKADLDPKSGKASTDKLIVESVQHQVRRADGVRDGRMGIITTTLLHSEGQTEGGELQYIQTAER